MLNRRTRGAAIAVAVALSPLAAEAQEAEPYSLEGETIRMLIPNAAGGMSDVQARLLMQYMELPGDPTVIVQDLEGAGGLRMLRYLDEFDPASDLTIFSVQSGMPFRARAGLIDAELFDPRTVNWIGSFRGSTLYCLVRTDSGIETLDDLREQSVLFGATAVTGNDYAVYTLLNEQLGLQIEPIVGYGSGATIALAVERGEVQGICNNYANYVQFMQQAAETGDVRILFYMSPEPRDDIDAPYLYDLPMSDEEETFIRTAVGAISFGNPYAIPEGADPQFVAAVREAFAVVMANPEFLEAAGALGVDLQFITGDQILMAVEELYAAPDEVVGQIGDMFFGE